MNFRIVYAILLFLALPLFAISQSEEQAIENVVKEMAETVDNLKTNLDAQRYLGYFTPSYQAMRSDYLVDGSASHHTVTLETMKRRLQSFAMDINQSVDYKVDKINYVQVLGKTAIVNFTAKFSITDGGKLVFGGVQNVTQTMVNTDLGWKVSRSHITEVRDNMQKYTCKYELYSKGKDEALLQVHYPAGNTFQTEYIDVIVEETGSKNYQIQTSRGDQLSWQNGRLYLPDPNSNMTKTVAVTGITGVYSELVKYYHPDQCSDAEMSK